MKKRLEAIVYGYVQGVYFRYYTKREAENLGLTGWVANRSDGAVQVVAEGDKIGEKHGCFVLEGKESVTLQNVKDVYYVTNLS